MYGSHRALVFLAAAAAVALARPACGQQPALPSVDSVAVVTLRLTDGTELRGRVVARDDSSLVVLTVAGLRVVAPRRAVAGWRAELPRVGSTRFAQSDPNTSRLFFGPTGRTLAGGHGYFADYFLFLSFVGVGLQDRVTLAGGMSLFPGADRQLVYVAPKVGLVRSPTVNAAAGGIYATIPGVSGSVGAAYGALTLGSEDLALTVVGGYAFANGERARSPGLIVGGEARLSNGVKLLGEAWKLPGASQVPIIVGFRFFGSHVAADFGGLRVLGTDLGGFPFVPWVDFVVSF
jgi:hypothetical protein